MSLIFYDFFFLGYDSGSRGGGGSGGSGWQDRGGNSGSYGYVSNKFILYKKWKIAKKLVYKLKQHYLAWFVTPQNV